MDTANLIRRRGLSPRIPQSPSCESPERVVHAYASPQLSVSAHSDSNSTSNSRFLIAPGQGQGFRHPRDYALPLIPESQSRTFTELVLDAEPLKPRPSDSHSYSIHAEHAHTRAYTQEESYLRRGNSKTSHLSAVPSPNFSRERVLSQILVVIALSFLFESSNFCGPSKTFNHTLEPKLKIKARLG